MPPPLLQHVLRVEQLRLQYVWQHVRVQYLRGQHVRLQHVRLR
jgi:hypothetical protein